MLDARVGYFVAQAEPHSLFICPKRAEDGKTIPLAYPFRGAVENVLPSFNLRHGDKAALRY